MFVSWRRSLHLLQTVKSVWWTETQAANWWTENIAGCCYTSDDSANLSMVNKKKTGLPIVTPSSPCFLLYLSTWLRILSPPLCCPSPGLLEESIGRLWNIPAEPMWRRGNVKTSTCTLWQRCTHTRSQSDGAPRNMLLYICVQCSHYVSSQMLACM